MASGRLSVRKEISRRSEEIIIDTENIIDKLSELESFAKEKNRPHLHYHAFHNDLQTFVDQFKRMLR